jgi:hypothetical protein
MRGSFMSHKTRRLLVFVGSVSLLVSACGHREMIPTSELNEIRQLAFKDAIKCYVLSDPEIESRYEPPREIANKLPPKGSFAANDSFLSGILARRGPLEVPEVRVPAVASVRGVRLTPLTRTECSIEFDFEASGNPHSQLPRTETTAKRFERKDGAHYWLIVW